MAGDSDQLLLGLDVGTTRIKAVLVDPHGVERRCARGPTPFAAVAEGAEMAAGELLAAVGEVLGGLGAEREAVAAVGVAGMGECGAPLGPDGRPLGPIIAWYDPRGQEVVERVLRRLGEALPLRLGSRLRTVSSVAKLGWWTEHRGGRPSRWLGVPELCLHALSGAAATDPSLASRTGWYDVRDRVYLPEVVEEIGVPAEALPPVVPAGAVAGRVSQAGAAWSGIPAGVPVTPAGHDHLAAAAGCAAGAGDLVGSAGTAVSLVRHLSIEALEQATVALALELGTPVSVRPDGTGWATLGRGPRAGRVLPRVAGALGEPMAVLDAAAVDGAAVEVCGLVDRLIAGEEDPILPPASPGELWGALLDELARRAAAAAALCDRLAGPSARVIVAGGGASSRPWLRATARHLAAPVWRAAVSEAAARGAAVAAGVAAGWWPRASAAPPPELERVTARTRG